MNSHNREEKVSPRGAFRSSQLFSPPSSAVRGQREGGLTEEGPRHQCPCAPGCEGHAPQGVGEEGGDPEEDFLSPWERRFLLLSASKLPEEA